MKRSPILYVAPPLLIICLFVLALQWSSGPSPLPMRDFVEYWSAGKAFLDGGNPYDPYALRKLQRDALDDPELEKAMMMWNPPWALPLVAPLGMLTPKLAHPIWLLLQLSSVLLSVGMLISVCGIPRDRSIPVVIACLCFTPFHLLLWYGQIGGFCLLGLSGYLYFIRRDRPIVAGMFAALTALKPHLLFLFGLLLLLDARTSRGRRVVVGGVMVIIVSTLLAIAINPAVFSYYTRSIAAPPSDAHENVRTWAAPLFSYYLRIGIDPATFAIQLLPCLLMSLAALCCMIRTPVPPDRAEIVSVAALLSAFFAAYGAWIFDLVILIVPVVHAASMLQSRGRGQTKVAIVCSYLFLNLCSTALPLMAVAAFGFVFEMQWFVYFTPCMIMLYYATWKGCQHHG